MDLKQPLRHFLGLHFFLACTRKRNNITEQIDGVGIQRQQLLIQLRSFIQTAPTDAASPPSRTECHPAAAVFSKPAVPLCAASQQGKAASARFILSKHSPRPTCACQRLAIDRQRCLKLLCRFFEFRLPLQAQPQIVMRRRMFRVPLRDFRVVALRLAPLLLLKAQMPQGALYFDLDSRPAPAPLRAPAPPRPVFRRSPAPPPPPDRSKPPDASVSAEAGAASPRSRRSIRSSSIKKTSFCAMYVSFRYFPNGVTWKSPCNVNCSAPSRYSPAPPRLEPSIRPLVHLLALHPGSEAIVHRFKADLVMPAQRHTHLQRRLLDAAALRHRSLHNAQPQTPGLVRAFRAQFY